MLVTSPTTRLWRDAIAVNWTSRFNAVPTDGALSVLWAQWAIETGRGLHCFGWNLGNIRAFEGWIGLWQVLPTFEYVGGKRINVDGDFRYFETILEGASDYLRFLSRDSYAKVMERVLAGDAAGFAHILKILGYYTGPEVDYTHGVVSLASEFIRDVSSQPPTSIALTDEETVEHAADEEAMQESLPLACYDPTTLRDTLVRFTCDEAA